ncbi:PDZ domain-containing protein [Sphingobacterium olei]|uniref:PDZ domain-containing protein n=1 Tax=Sphingobacterium olei TaxID=2571155 RepID=A0A4U0NGH2_9SPHI|nr:PDZ domain-containing protein [Sphingobacterium olei]TJZ53271.1 PDZ domain-containing protein [Sphingobacterium olei]
MARIIFILCILISFSEICGQQWVFKNNANKITFSFELIHHVVIIPIHINGEELSFILDTGVKETLLFGHSDSLTLHNVSKVKFQGIGIDEGIEGLLSLSNHLSVADSAMIDLKHNLFVIMDDSLHLSNHIGLPVHGILGSNFFHNNVVEINYVKKKITVYRNIKDIGKKLKGYEKIPLQMEKDRPYVKVDLRIGKKTYEQVKVLLDLGNSDPAMLFTDRLSGFEMLEPAIYEFIGKGFNGNIYGKRNRIHSLQINNFEFQQPIISYPDANTYDTKKLVKDRVGSIGNQLLTRFSVLIDYQSRMLYLKPNKNFRQPFYIDMSGVEVKHEGFVWVESKIYLNTSPNREGTTIPFDGSSSFKYKIELKPNFIINSVRDNSPAKRIGVMKGDVLLKINGRSVQSLSLEQIKEKLQSGINKTVKLQIERDEKIINFSFQLQDPIPLLL